MGKTREAGDRHVYLLIDKELHIETPLGTIIMTATEASKYAGGVRVEMRGDLIQGARNVRSSSFSGIALEHNGGEWLWAWQLPDDHNKAKERWEQTGGGQ